MWRAFYLVFSLSSSQWVYLVDRTFSHYKQIQPPANKRCTDGKRAQHKYLRGDQVGIRLGYSASNVGNAEGRCGGVEWTRNGQKADRTRSGADKGQSRQRAERAGLGRETNGRPRQGTDKRGSGQRAGRERRASAWGKMRGTSARDRCMERMHEVGTKKRTSNLYVKWQVARKPRKRRVCLAHELQGGSGKLPRASTTLSGSVAILKQSGIVKGKQQPGSSR